jgi:hypothetical protein
LGYTIPVLLILSLAGAARAAECTNCTGTGILVKKCDACGGNGNYQCKFCKGLELRGTGNSTGVIVCITCRGRGSFRGAAGGRVPCKRCQGKGRFKCPKCIRGRLNCKTCSAAGQLTRKCPLCTGTGKVAAGANKDALRAEKARLSERLTELRAELAKLRKRLAEIDAELGIKPPPQDPKKPPENDDEDF